MQKYIGMTARDPYLRKQEWESKGIIVVDFKVLYSGLTYDQALAIEREYETTKGYKAEPGGPRFAGPAYFVYIYSY